jgi:prolyl-tRNA editing enzyme YbaK/EbsC (Cys-tRNA(Pro) deacylase)
MTTNFNDALTRGDLQAFIEQNRIDALVLPLAKSTATVPEAAAALGVETDQIVKSLVFEVRGEPLLVINNGLARVDHRKLAGRLGVGRKRIKLADPQWALEITGYAVGGMPPFGHRSKLRTLVDRAIAGLGVVYGGGGGNDTMLKLGAAELVRVTAAEMCDLAVSPNIA